MQCHRCPKNGKPDETCITCKCAEYLDNDHKTVIPTDNESLLKNRSRPVAHRFASVSPRVAEDCANVLEDLKHCHRDSFPHLLKLFLVFASLGANATFLQSGLQGQSFTDYAKGEGISRQASMQRWNRMAAQFPEIRSVIRRRKKDDGTRHTLDEGQG